MLQLRTSFKLGLAVLLISHAFVAYAQTEPKLPLFDFTPLVGYRTSITFTAPPEPDTVSSRIVLDPSPSYGLAFGARLNDEDVIELRWARQNTFMRVEQNLMTAFRQNATLDQFHADFTHEYILEYWPPSIRPYIMGSIGATHISGNLTAGFTRISIGLGAGFKVFVNHHLGFRIQGEWLPIVVDPDVAFVCGVGCVVRIRSQLSSQGEFTVGPVLRF